MCAGCLALIVFSCFF